MVVPLKLAVVCLLRNSSKQTTLPILAHHGQLGMKQEAVISEPILNQTKAKHTSELLYFFNVNTYYMHSFRLLRSPGFFSS